MKLSIWLRGAALAAVFCSALLPAHAGEARLLRHPAVSEDHVAFVYAGDVWLVDRDGGDARRLTTFHGTESDPHFSPDGKHVAYLGVDDKALGFQARRLYVMDRDGSNKRSRSSRAQSERSTWTWHFLSPFFRFVVATVALAVGRFLVLPRSGERSYSN